MPSPEFGAKPFAVGRRQEVWSAKDDVQAKLASDRHLIDRGQSRELARSAAAALALDIRKKVPAAAAR